MQNREQPNHGTKMNFYEGMPKRNFQQQGIANGCWETIATSQPAGILVI